MAETFGRIRVELPADAGAKLAICLAQSRPVIMGPVAGSFLPEAFSN
jgi:hypothetical protein